VSKHHFSVLAILFFMMSPVMGRPLSVLAPFITQWGPSATGVAGGHSMLPIVINKERSYNHIKNDGYKKEYERGNGWGKSAY